MANGMAMMMKSFGIDPEKIITDFTALKEGVLKTLTGIDERLARIETQQAELLKLTQELTAWKRQQMSLQLLARSQPPSQPDPPNLPHSQPPANQPLQPSPLNPL